MQSVSFDFMILTRILMAVVLGFGLGLERELTNKYAGLRTHILVCLGSAVFTVLSIYAFPQAVTHTDAQAFGDPARIAAQILTGIGFIGGGTVLRHGPTVHGLTTAATLWVAAAIGMACGTGMLTLAALTTVMSVFVLVLVRTFERNVLPSTLKNLKKIKIVVHSSEPDASAIHDYIVGAFSHMVEISQKPSEKGENVSKITAIINISMKKPVQSLYKKFRKFKGIESISIQEDNE